MGTEPAAAPPTPPVTPRPRAGLRATLVILAAILVVPFGTLLLLAVLTDPHPSIPPDGVPYLVAFLSLFAVVLACGVRFVRARTGTTDRRLEVAMSLTAVGLALFALGPRLPVWTGRERAGVVVALLSIGLLLLIGNLSALRARAWPRLVSVLGLLAGAVVLASLVAALLTPARGQSLFLIFGPAVAVLVWLIGLMATVAARPLLAGAFLAYLAASAWRISTLPDEEQHAARLSSMREEIRRLEAVAAKLPEFAEKRTQLERELSGVRCRVPVAMELDSFESSLRALLASEKAGGVEIVRVGDAESYRGLSAQELHVTAAEPVLRRALARECRYVQVFGREPAGARTKVRLRVFAEGSAAASAPRTPEERDEALPLPEIVFDPVSWFRVARLRELQAQLNVATARQAQLQVIKRQVEHYHGNENSLADAKRALAVLRAPATTDLEVVALVAAGDGWAARIRRDDNLPDDADWLWVGTRLYDGVVKSVESDHVIVEADLPVSGRPAVKRLLRFAPPQPLPRLTAAADTTRLTSPLLPDGTPDYGRWLNQKYGAGVTTDNNAAELLESAQAKLVDAGQTFYDNSPGGKVSRWFSEPWSPADCPACAERLKKNEAALLAVTDAVRRPRFFVRGPEGGRFSTMVFPSLLKYRHWAHALAGRGMLRLRGGDLHGARQDALTVQKLATLIGQGRSLIEHLIAIAVQGIGAPLVGRVSTAQPPAAETKLFLDELQSVPPVRHPMEALDETERYSNLDQLLALRQSAADRGPGALLELERAYVLFMGDSDRVDPLVYLVPASLFDWDEALRLANRNFDLAVAVMRAASLEERRRASAAAEAEVEARKAAVKAVSGKLRRSKPSDVAEAAREMARTKEGSQKLAALLVSPPELYRAAIAWNESETVTRLHVIAAALAAHRFAAGSYPPQLAQLTSGLLRGRFAEAAPPPGYLSTYTATAGGFALTAWPEEKAVTGNRAFCVDSTGITRFTTDGVPPKLAGGACDKGAPLLR